MEGGALRKLRDPTTLNFNEYVNFIFQVLYTFLFMEVSLLYVLLSLSSIISMHLKTEQKLHLECTSQKWTRKIKDK